jgi:hypothetical protein
MFQALRFGNTQSHSLYYYPLGHRGGELILKQNHQVISLSAGRLCDVKQVGQVDYDDICYLLLKIMLISTLCPGMKQFSQHRVM